MYFGDEQWTWSNPNSLRSFRPNESAALVPWATCRPRCTRWCPRRRCRRRRGGREGCRQPETWWTERSPWWWLVTLDAKTLKVSWDIWDHWRIIGKLWKSIGKSESNKHVWHHQWAGFGGVHQPRLSEEMIKDENRVAMHHKHPWNENRWPSQTKTSLSSLVSIRSIVSK